MTKTACCQLKSFPIDFMISLASRRFFFLYLCNLQTVITDNDNVTFFRSLLNIKSMPVATSMTTISTNKLKTRNKQYLLATDSASRPT